MGPTGPTGAPGVDGKDGVSGYVVTAPNTATLTGAGTQNAEAFCPAGKKAFGATFSTENIDATGLTPPIVTSSVALTGMGFAPASGWRVSAWFGGTGAWSVTVQAVCATAP